MPMALVAATRNVYAVPLVSPVTTVLVGAAGTTLAAWAVAPTNGVTT